MLFAGVLAAGNIQRPKLGDTPLDASVDFFAIAVPSSDRAVRRRAAKRERARADLAADDRLQSRLAGDAVSEGDVPVPVPLRRLRERPDDGRDFDVPSSTLTNGIGGAWEYRRGGYSLLLNGAWFGRAALARLGLRSRARRPRRPSPQTYVKYSAGLSRDFYLNAFHKIHLNGAWFGGRDLDRFVQVSVRDVRRHADPRRAGVGRPLRRAGDGARLVFAQIFEQYRLDLFLEHAWGRDDPGRGTWQPIPGSAWRSTCGRRGIRFSAPTSARACCRRATTRSARRRCRSCC